MCSRWALFGRCLLPSRLREAPGSSSGVVSARRVREGVPLWPSFLCHRRVLREDGYPSCPSLASDHFQGPARVRRLLFQGPSLTFLIFRFLHGQGRSLLLLGPVSQVPAQAGQESVPAGSVFSGSCSGRVRLCSCWGSASLFETETFLQVRVCVA